MAWKVMHAMVGKGRLASVNTPGACRSRKEACLSKWEERSMSTLSNRQESGKVGVSTVATKPPNHAMS